MANEKQVVKCASCGERVYDGYRSYTEHRDASDRVYAFTLGDERYCECCKEQAGERPAEFRTCGYCGAPFSAGYTVEGGGWYCCEECFDEAMNADYPLGWDVNDHEDDPHWCDGYYDYKAADGTWHDTGIFYTEWY